MDNTENERLLHEIDKLEKIVNQLKFDFTLLYDEDLKKLVELIDYRVKRQKLLIRAEELKKKLAERLKK